MHRSILTMSLAVTATLFAAMQSAPAAAHSKIHCQFDYVATCKAGGGSHRYCFANAPSVCAGHHAYVGQPGYTSSRRGTSLRLKRTNRLRRLRIQRLR